MGNATTREVFVQAALAQVGKPAVWGHKGPKSYDCSGLVTWALYKANVIDARVTHNAQRIHDECEAVAEGSEGRGDLAFYGSGPKKINHVVIVLGDGWVLSASGARSTITTVAAAESLGARVRTHSKVRYRRDFVCFKRNTYIEKFAKDAPPPVNTTPPQRPSRMSDVEEE